jgi:hypothetical protein
MEIILKSLILAMVVSLNLLASANASEKFVYTFKKMLVGRGKLEYIVKNVAQITNDETYYEISSSTEIYMFGSLSNKMTHLSSNRKDLSPIKNIYCTWPKPKNSPHSCSAVNFTDDGSYLFKEFSTESLELLNLSVNDMNVGRQNIQDTFADFTPYADRLHDLASFFLSPRYDNLGIEDDGKEFYLALLGKKAKLILRVSKYGSGLLKFKFEPVKGTDSKVVQYIPDFAIFSPRERLITQIQLKSIVGPVTVILDRKQSRLSNL